MIDGYTREAGVRRLEQLIASVCRKAAKRIAEGEEKISVKESDLQALLGNPKFKEEKLRDSDESSARLLALPAPHPELHTPRAW